MNDATKLNKHEDISMTKKRGLGRSLEALLQGLGEAPVAEVVSAEEKVVSEYRQLPIEYLKVSRFQPRRHFDEESLKELSDSIKSQGILQPLVVRLVSDKSYEIIAGERRWRAAQLAGLTEVPALIKDISDDVALAVAIIENIQREDLNPIEEAVGLQRLIHEFHMTHEDIAKVVGRSRVAVTNLLRLLDLAEEVREYLQEGSIDMGHARALLALEHMDQRTAVQQIIAKKMSVREAERLVQTWNQPKPSKKAEYSADTDIHQLQTHLSEKLGTKVMIQHQSKGKGRLVISYNSLDELDGILGHIT